MSKLETLIQQLCPNGVEYKKIDEVAECLAGATPKTSIPAYWENGTIPWMSSGEVNNKVIYKTGAKITQKGYESCSTKMVPPNTVVVALAGQGKTRGTVAITRIELCTNQSLCSIITTSELLPDFLYHYLNGQYNKLRDISSGDGTRGGLNLKMIKNFLVPVPPLEVQREIVRILDNFTELTAELTEKLIAELTARKKQYEYYKNKLLGDLDAEGVPLNMVCNNIFSGKNKVRLIDGMYPVYGSTGIISTTNIPVYKKEQILIARVGANAGFVHIANGEYDVSDNTLIVDLKEGISLKYVYYQLSSMNLHQYAKGGGQPLVTAGQIKKLKIVVPSLEKQLKIVSILDRFDAICNDLTSGLPAEIAARQKQYEYYRDKLLTFKPLT